jgi:hypothetical protein
MSTIKVNVAFTGKILKNTLSIDHCIHMSSCILHSYVKLYIAFRQRLDTLFSVKYLIIFPILICECYVYLQMWTPMWKK